MRLWLNDCMSMHPACSSDKVNVTVTPTRLLFVSNGHLALVHTSKLPKRPLYLTLSHCWGNIEILKLRRSNIQDFEVEIPEQELCQTFKDAVFITRALGYQYIWIDSLCIIQDDPEDWRQEASTMSSVYSGTALNLAATGAVDGSVGCFSHRSNHTLQQIKRYNIRAPANWTWKWFTCVNYTIHRDSMINSPLAERGWAFQERFLAPRTLHFTKSQLYWECREKMACETQQEGLRPNGPLIYSTLHDVLKRNALNEIWLSVIRLYSRCKLTFAKDKLVAISGVARWLHTQTGDEYCAGLWRCNLESQLLWRNAASGNVRRNPGNWPSWSWSAFDNAILAYPSPWERAPPKTFLSKVVNTEVTLAGEDPFGDVISGKLRILTGLLVGCIIQIGDSYSTRTTATLLNGTAVTFTIYDDMGRTEPLNSLWYCLPLVLCPNSGDDYIKGLMLEAIPGSITGQFRRVGHFTGFPTDNLVDAMNDPQCRADKSVYESSAGLYKQGKEQYYITIV
jgi:hypothetical protein